MLLCSNLVKFGRREIGEIVRYLSDKKFCLPLKLSLLRGSCPVSARASPQQCTQRLRIHCWGLALADFGSGLRSSDRMKFGALRVRVLQI